MKKIIILLGGLALVLTVVAAQYNIAQTTTKITGTLEVTGVITGNGSGLTNLAPAALSTGTITNPISYEASSAGAPAGNELARASWVRGLFDGSGVSYYATTNVNGSFTNAGINSSNTLVFEFNQSQPTYYSTRAYTTPTNGTYIGLVVTTNTFLQINAGVTFNAMLSGAGGSGSGGAQLKPEIYISYDRTNWLGDWSASYQNITEDTTNLYSWVIANPTYVSTNATGFYVGHTFKVGTQASPTASTITFHVGTNAVVTTPSHISLSGASSSSGNAYLAANQTWTGSNIFNGGLHGNAAGLTNLIVTNLVSTVFNFPSVTNAITLNKELWKIEAATSGSVTNTKATGWATLAVSNSSAGNITFYLTNALWRPLGQATTNFAPAGAFLIPAAKVGWIDFDNRAGYTAYSCSLQQ